MAALSALNARVLKTVALLIVATMTVLGVGDPASAGLLGNDLGRLARSLLFGLPPAPPVRPLDLTVGDTTVRSNLNAGGSVWEWTSGGFQYINHRDFGREIQTSLFTVDALGRVANPTEAGNEIYSAPHASPVVTARNGGSTQITQSIPMEWHPDLFGGGSALPVRREQMRMGKEVTLGVHGPHVARYRTTVTLPKPISAFLEMPTAYLVATLNAFYGVEADGRVVAIDPPNQQITPTLWTTASPYAAIVATDDSGEHAFGLYARTAAAGGPATSFSVHRFFGWDNGTTAESADTTKITVNREGPMASGANAYDAYVLTGTLDEVRANVISLAAQGIG